MHLCPRSALVGCALALASSPAFAFDAHPALAVGGAAPSTLAVYGDAPYGTTPGDDSELKATPAFIDNVNADPDVSIVLHVGDIHSGKQYCTEAYDRTIFDLWRRFDDPLVYTPGDNEWTDCHKAAEGGGTYDAASGTIKYVLDASGSPVDYANGDPVANLELVRSIFFPLPGVTLGRHRKLVLSQAEIPSPLHPSDQQFVENVMWIQSRVLIVAINLPGGSNDDGDAWYGAPTASPTQLAEAQLRDGADLRWLDLAFTIAEWAHLDGVIIQAQADMWDPEKGPAHQTSYEPYVRAVAEHTTRLGKPVLMLNGDSHAYLSDNPLGASDPLAYMHPGYDVANFHRIVVHGSTFPLEWLKLTIDPKQHAAPSDNAFGPFRWQRITQ